MTLETYRILHLCGLMLLFFGLGGVLISYYGGVVLPKKARLLAFITHGIGMFLLITAGFGMLGKLGLMASLPNWVYSKLLIWLLLGLGVAMAKRQAQMAFTLTIAFVLLAATAAHLGLHH